jgi:hypothetical protein
VIVAGLVAAGVILAQGWAVWAFLKFVKSFGAYTESQVKVYQQLHAMHQANVLLHEETARLLAELKRQSLTTERVA